MDNYLRKKYYLRKQNDINSAKIEDISPASCVIVDWDFEEQKLSKCRLCQEKKIDHSLLEDKTLCERIIECTSLKVSYSICFT